MQIPNRLIAVILCGGQGTRLRPAVADRPKVLAEVRGRPFVCYLLDQLAEFGVQQVVLCTGYLGEQIQTLFGENYGALRLHYSREEQPLGTAGALHLALPFLTSDPVLVLNGDSFCRTDLGAFVNWHAAHRAPASLLLMHVPDTRRSGRVAVDAAGQVTQFVEKGTQSGAGWINGGVYLLSQQMLVQIPAQRAGSLEREIFPAQIGRGLCGYQANGEFIDIGLPETYAAAQHFFSGQD
jgi:D-glycero-alpha-D-manno-heptose 1-phosphate guanylyltransferase